MENKKKILGKHKSILQLLKKHNKLYFLSDNPKISDDEYDQIFATLFKKRRCTNESLMCSSGNNHFPKYYWYKIYRRAFCQ